MDSQSTVHHFGNEAFVTNIRQLDATLRLATNGGVATTNLIADTGGVGTVWFDPKAITNIYSLACMADKYRITYDSSVERAFIVHTEYGPLKFVERPDGLYAMVEMKQQQPSTPLPTGVESTQSQLAGVPKVPADASVETPNAAALVETVT